MNTGYGAMADTAVIGHEMLSSGQRGPEIVGVLAPGCSPARRRIAAKAALTGRLGRARSPGKNSATQASQCSNRKQRKAARLWGRRFRHPMHRARRVNFLKLPDWPEVRIVVSTVQEPIHASNLKAKGRREMVP